MLPGHHCSSRRPLCLLLVVLAAVLLGPCHRVEAYISGAPPETCDTILPQHQSLSAIAYSNCATLLRFSLCLTPTIAGVSVVAEQFEYNCAQDYTITLSGHGSSQRGFMVEFRESSDSVSFDGSLSHVGEFGVASGFNTTTRLECQGHAVTQTVINTAGTSAFVWTAPQIGQHKTAQLWVTQVVSSQAYFLPRTVVLGVPNEVSCTCPENTYLSVEQTTPVYRVSCRACPANSRSDRGVQTFCACVEGFGRRGVEVSDSSPCVGCFTTSPTNLTVLSSQLPTVLISWTAPDDISGFEVLYRVTAGNTSTNVTLEEGTSLPMAALFNLSPGASYTLHVSAYTESGCLTPPASTAITALERCPNNPPNITNVAAVPGDVALSYSHPTVTDPMIRPEVFLYAVYHRCGTDTGFTLAASGIRSLFYNLQGLPASTMCTARVLVYSVYCPLVYSRLAAEHSFNTTADVDECSTGEHGCSHICTNTPGSYQCSCREGYELTRSNKKCRDIDECRTNSHSCSDTCTNTEGSYSCSCREGYTLQSDQKTCEDVDECSAAEHGCSHICSNTPGSYQCSCREGYELTENQRTCEEVVVQPCHCRYGASCDDSGRCLCPPGLNGSRCEKAGRPVVTVLETSVTFLMNKPTGVGAKFESFHIRLYQTKPRVKKPVRIYNTQSVAYSVSLPSRAPPAKYRVSVRVKIRGQRLGPATTFKCP